jgi:D-erythro-7,8-dihydroneopterin triphosphate epimerase
MSDRIHIEDLLLRAVLGINDAERTAAQDVLIGMTLEVDTAAAGRSDDIADAVNYRTITKRVIEHVQSSQYYLVERMAAAVAEICLDDPRVEGVRVRVDKPGALRYARTVGVEIHRTRPDRS